jgi:hypothetical protein
MMFFMARAAGRRFLLPAIAFALVPTFAFAAEATPPSRDAVQAAMVRAAAFFRDKIGVNGGYVWSVSADGRVRRGEGKTSGTIGWVQPPGTPAVGAAFLKVHEATGDSQWLDAAGEVAKALVASQLLSGGWYYSMETDPAKRAQWCYRVDKVDAAACKAIEGNKARDRSVLDDNTTQSVLDFLLSYDEAVDGRDQAVREALGYGFDALVKHQYRNGAWPIYSDQAGRDDGDPSLKASLPAAWPRDWVKPQKGPYYITNDNAIRDVVHALLHGYRRLGRPDLLEAAKRGGDFLIAAQIPDPQAGWAQTYDETMQPVWGRVFEPPSIVSEETAGGIETLLMLHAATDDARYLAAAERAGDWLRKVRLPDGRWARFYELGTDKPLYVDMKNKVTYSDAELLDHYTLKSEFFVPSALDALDAARKGVKPPFVAWPSAADDLSQDDLAETVAEQIAAQDKEGRWVEDGWIDSQTFVDTIFEFARYLKPS